METDTTTHYATHQFRQEISEEEAIQEVIKNKVLLWRRDAQILDTEVVHTTWGSRPALEVTVYYTSKSADKSQEKLAAALDSWGDIFKD